MSRDAHFIVLMMTLILAVLVVLGVPRPVLVLLLLSWAAIHGSFGAMELIRARLSASSPLVLHNALLTAEPPVRQSGPGRYVILTKLRPVLSPAFSDVDRWTVVPGCWFVVDNLGRPATWWCDQFQQPDDGRVLVIRLPNVPIDWAIRASIREDSKGVIDWLHGLFFGRRGWGDV
jgi:hypothetical protein